MAPPKDLVDFINEPLEYDTGFDCVHGRSFDCDDCLSRLSKRQRADAAEIAKLKAELKTVGAQYDELKSHLEMYKDQWKRHWEGRKAELEAEQQRWFTEHLNHEVDDVREELNEVLTEKAHAHGVLKRIVERCSWTRDEHDPLVSIGLMANDALSHDASEGWVGPKAHSTSLEKLRARLEKAAVGALTTIDDQLRVSSAMRALPLEE